MPISEVHCIDCVAYMRTLPDNFFDVAICDPPYGDALSINEITPPENQSARAAHGSESTPVQPLRRMVQPLQAANYPPNSLNRHQSKSIDISRKSPSTTASEDASTGTSRPRVNHAWGGRFDRYALERPAEAPFPECRTDREEVKYGTIDWDIAPPPEYWEELFRVSKNQIIWGGNYFPLPPTRCFVVWRKLSISENFSMAMAEYAWTSFNDNAKVFECVPQRDKTSARFHPTEKPIALYQFLLRNFAREGDKIFDPNLGSQNSRIAAYGMGYDFYGCEICKDYFDKGCANFERVCHGTEQGAGGQTIYTPQLF